MAKEKQVKAKNLKAKKLKCIETPELPVINLPNWLPKPVSAALLDYVDKESGWQYNEVRPGVDFWQKHVRSMELMLPAFTDHRVRESWTKLHTINNAAAIKLVKFFFATCSKFEAEMSWHEALNNENELAKRILREAESLHDSLWHFQQSLFRRAQHPDQITLMKLLKRFIDSSAANMAHFHDLAAKDRKKRKRKVHTSTAEREFFAVELSDFFKHAYGKPLNNHVVNFTNVIFEAGYSESHISKLTRKSRLSKKN